MAARRWGRASLQRLERSGGHEDARPDEDPDDDDLFFSWAYKEDVTFDAGSPVGVTFEWRAGMLCVASFTPISPARDSGLVAIDMVLTAINGSSVLFMSQRDVSMIQRLMRMLRSEAY
jgi:hypothetical protein